MQAPLLIYFKEYTVEFWTIDQSRRLVPINCGLDNRAPLYFLVSGDQISMDQNAKMQFDSNLENAFGDYWINILNPQLKYNRFNASHPFSSLLSYAIKENILPDIIRNNYSGFTQESFLNTCKTIIVYDSFIDEQHRHRVNKDLIEVIGFNPSTLVTFDYWELYRAYYEKNGSINSKESFLSINSALGDLKINLVAQNPTLTINKKTLIGRGNDPRLDTILEYVAEIAVRKGSLLPVNEIKKKIASDGPAILSLLNEGWVYYKIKNYDIGVYPLILDFHKDAVANRLNNRASLNFIQGEFDNFRNANQATGHKIFLNGEIINQDIFIDFFKTTYSSILTEGNDFSGNFLLFTFDYLENQLNISHLRGKEPTSLAPSVQITPPINVKQIASPSTQQKPLAPPPTKSIPPAVKSPIPPKVTAPPPMPPKVSATPPMPPKVTAPPTMPPKVSAPPPMPPKVSATPPMPPKVTAPPPIPPKVTAPPPMPPKVKAPIPPPPPPKKVLPPPPPKNNNSLLLGNNPELERLISTGQILAAVKHLKDTRNIGLIEAKKWIENYLKNIKK